MRLKKLGTLKILLILSLSSILIRCQSCPKPRAINVKIYTIDVENHRLFRAQTNDSISLMDNKAGNYVAISYPDLYKIIREVQSAANH